MNLRNQKRIAAEILKCSAGRVIFDKDKVDEIKEAITKADLRGLISEGLIKKRQAKGVSRGRARERAPKRRRGQGKGQGSRKGAKGAREGKKRVWINHVRKQRKYLAELKESDKLSLKAYRTLYLKSKGGFFRNLRHLKLYLNETGMMKK